MYIIVYNELDETFSKRQKTLSSLTPQTRNTNTVIFDYGASCSYTIIVNNLIANFKNIADPNLESDIKCTISDPKIPRSLKK